jgi:signal transduction histidine kinase
MDVRMIAHDMRTPLNALSLSISAAKAKACEDSELLESLDMAERNARVLSQIMEALLDTCDAGKAKLEFGECIPADLSASAIDQIQPMAVLKHLNISSELSDALPTLIADGSRIVRVLVNLLSNAVRFSPANGNVRISAKARSNDGHDVMVFAVADEGPGVNPQDMEKVFARGVSIGNGGKYSSGLGLAVCKEIVEAHGGRIWIETNRTNGATFAFSIPTDLKLGG